MVHWSTSSTIFTLYYTRTCNDQNVLHTLSCFFPLPTLYSTLTGFPADNSHWNTMVSQASSLNIPVS